MRRQELLTCHTAAHLDFLELAWQQEHFHINGDTYSCKDSKLAANLSCGIVIDLVKRFLRPLTSRDLLLRRLTACPSNDARVLGGETRNGFGGIRPPGHHAEADEAMGFCMYNNVAVAAKVAREQFGVGCGVLAYVFTAN